MRHLQITAAVLLILLIAATPALAQIAERKAPVTVAEDVTRSGTRVEERIETQPVTVNVPVYGQQTRTIPALMQCTTPRYETRCSQIQENACYSYTVFQGYRYEYRYSCTQVQVCEPVYSGYISCNWVVRWQQSCISQWSWTWNWWGWSWGVKPFCATYPTYQQECRWVPQTTWSCSYRPSCRLDAIQVPVYAQQQICIPQYRTHCANVLADPGGCVTLRQAQSLTETVVTGYRQETQWQQIRRTVSAPYSYIETLFKWGKRFGR